MNKDLKDKAIKIKGKDYVQVKDRILYLAENEKYSIETDYEYFPDRKMWVVKAKLTIGERTYTGLAQEVESDDYKQVNFASALENAETSAVGRACAMAGIGVLDSIASADEMTKAHNRQNINEGKRIAVQSDFSQKDRMKKLEGAMWDGGGKIWSVLDTPENRSALSYIPNIKAVDSDGELIEFAHEDITVEEADDRKF